MKISIIESDYIKTTEDLVDAIKNDKGVYVVEEGVIFVTLSSIIDDSYLRGVAEGEGDFNYINNEISRLAKLARKAIYG